MLRRLFQSSSSEPSPSKSSSRSLLSQPPLSKSPPSQPPPSQHQPIQRQPSRYQPIQRQPSQHQPIQRQPSQQQPIQHQPSQHPPPLPQRGPPLPPGADPDLWKCFSAVDTDGSGSITVTELQSALVNRDWSKFELDTVKMLMNTFDADRSGTIGFDEFQGLWRYIKDWQGVFRHFDQDHSGSIDERELSAALNNFGYKFSPEILSLIEQKYSSGPAAAGSGPPPGITFDRFLRVCVTIKALTEAFQFADADRDGEIRVNYEQFMGMIISAP